jgi:hypothetical protein
MASHDPERGRVSRSALLASATLVTIVTAGGLVGLGIQAREPLRAFRLAGRNLLGVAGLSTAVTRQAAILFGVLHHVAIGMFWGLLLSFVVLRLRGVSRLVACTLLVPIYTFVIPRLFPPVLRIGHVVTNTDGAVFPIAAVLALALLAGAWVAAAPRP